MCSFIDIKSVQGYYPGACPGSIAGSMMMPDRIYSSTQLTEMVSVSITTTETTTYEDDFSTSSGISKWDAGNSTITHDSANERMKVENDDQWDGTSSTYTTTAGKKYRIELDLAYGTCSDIRIEIFGINAPATYVHFDQVPVPEGHLEYSFTGWGTQTRIYIRRRSGTWQGNLDFYIDNFRLVEITDTLYQDTTYVATGNGYRYAFNGKEQDPEWNGIGAMYDYGFRIYDPRIAKFLSVDPLAPEYPWFSPYHFAGNMPISARDLDGLEPLVQNGKLVGYRVMAGQGPTQIAEDINDPKTQEKYGYCLIHPMDWRLIVWGNESRFPEKDLRNNGPGYLSDRYDKFDEEYTRLNVNPKDVLRIPFQPTCKKPRPLDDEPVAEPSPVQQHVWNRGAVVVTGGGLFVGGATIRVELNGATGYWEKGVASRNNVTYPLELGPGGGWGNLKINPDHIQNINTMSMAELLNAHSYTKSKGGGVVYGGGYIDAYDESGIELYSITFSGFITGYTTSFGEGSSLNTFEQSPIMDKEDSIEQATINYQAGYLQFKDYLLENKGQSFIDSLKIDTTLKVNGL